MNTTLRLTASCRCGGIEIEATGAPIVSSVCYCIVRGGFDALS